MARTRTPPDRARSRAKLLDVATDLFVRQGFQATSIDQIVRAAGYTRGALYWHFQGKEDLFAAVFEDAVQRMTARILERVAEATTCRERIEKAVVAVVEEAVLHHRVAALDVAYTQARSRSDDRKRGRARPLERQFTTFETELTKIITAGIKRGELRKVSPEMTAVCIVGLVEATAAAIVARAIPAPEVPGIAADTADFCLRALTP